MAALDRDAIQSYLLSLPERALRSASALAGGLLRELGDVTLPASVRRTKLYQNMVEATLRFLIEQVGQVEGAYPPEGKLAEDFLLRRTAGNGIEWIGILTFYASPVWVMAALADLSGAGRQLIAEIAASLKQEGLLEPEARFETMDELLNGLERSAGRLADTINTPPLNVQALRAEWAEIRAAAPRLPSASLPSIEELRGRWYALRREAAEQQRSVFELSALMAFSAVQQVPERVRWLSRSAQLATRRTGQIVAGTLLAHYDATLREIRSAGYLGYWTRQFRPYLRAAAQQFAPGRPSLTQRLLRRGS
ncbi:MAG: hypothetical protein ACK5AZ_05170 [Bryobacteraceae bacterium]